MQAHLSHDAHRRVGDSFFVLMKRESAGNSHSLREFLRGVPLFSGLDDPALAALAQFTALKRVPKGFVLFTEQEEGNAAYIVRSGSVAIMVTTPDGRELVINDMRAGDCFGEMALLTDSPRSATAMAREASELAIIPREQFLAELAARPRIMHRVLELLCGRLRSSTARESALAFMTMPARLSRVLLTLEQETGGKGYVTVSQQELAERIGAIRQTVAEILGTWRRKGWILTGRGKIVLLDRAALRRLQLNK